MKAADSIPTAIVLAETPSVPLPRWRWLVFAALCLGGIALLWLAASAGRFVSPVGWAGGEVQRMWNVFTWSLAAAMAVVLARPRVAHRWIAVALAAWIVVVFGPAAFAAVAFLGAAAALIGARLLRGFGLAPADPLTALLAGAVAIAAVIGATAAMKWHWPAAYALALAAGAAACWRDAPALGRAVAARWAPRPRATLRAGLLPLALLAATLAVHIVVAGKPEVGADALSMHLELAMEMARDHRFSFDVGGRIWAVMPLAADWLYAIAFQFAGEAAAKLANLGAFFLVLALIARLAAAGSGISPALPAAIAALFASMPLAFAETGTLFIENYWTALLLGCAATAERAVRERSTGWGLACLWLAAGAMQAKVLGLFWIAPLALVAAWSLRDRLRSLGWREAIAIAAALAVLAWPYANAWLRTGNPVFPFLNGVFRSPLFDSGESFINAMYMAPLTWRTWYDLVVDSGHYLEGAGGALGVHWLILFPAILLLVRRTQIPTVLPLLLFALAFSIAVYVQQSYLRYLYPAFALLLALAGRIAAPLPLASGALAFILALPLVAVNLKLMPSGVWWNATFCLRCSFDEVTRAQYIGRYAEQRLAVAWLNANAPSATVGWLKQHSPNPAGYGGPLWRISWHDYSTWRTVRDVTSADDMAEFARKRNTDYFVLPLTDGTGPFDKIIAELRDRYTTPIFVVGNTMIAGWADTADRRLLSLPADFGRVAHDAGTTVDGARLAFAPAALASFEFAAKSRVYSYRLVPACAPMEGRGIVQTVWFDANGQRLRVDLHYYPCSADGRAAVATIVAPPHAHKGLVYVGSAPGNSFALSDFALTAR